MAGDSAIAAPTDSEKKGMTVKKFNINAIAVAIGLVFSIGATAQSLSKADYKSAKDGIAADYKSAKAACASMADNAKDICQAEAKGKENVAKAELEARNKPSDKNRYAVSVANAKADYSVAKEKCDDKSGNDKTVCVKEAKATETRATADAKAQMKSSDANKTANETSTAARKEAKETGADARKDAAADKRSADYAVAKAKCDALAGDAKDRCMNDAKALYESQKSAVSTPRKASTASTSKKESPGEYVDDTVITAKVKAAVLNEPSLKSAEINVETSKGTVQLTGFVRSRADISKAVEVARGVNGVKSVKNDMILKGTQ